LKNPSGRPGLLLAVLGRAGSSEDTGSISLVPITSIDHQCLCFTFHDFASLRWYAENEQQLLLQLEDISSEMAGSLYLVIQQTQVRL